jgi:hypothetical protein
MPQSSWLSVGLMRDNRYEFYSSAESSLAAEVLARIDKLYEIKSGIRQELIACRLNLRKAICPSSLKVNVANAMAPLECVGARDQRGVPPLTFN